MVCVCSPCSSADKRCFGPSWFCDSYEISVPLGSLGGPSLLMVSALYYGVLSAVAIVDIRYVLFCPYYPWNNLNSITYFVSFRLSSV